ncbi:hypothetical protein CFE53_04400 [Methanofervidicoccus sp. A16]|uniref:MnmC family methyltransferase n=1 Tax=Methanofervidicoccus sp. A16 TaxID=2607662 RepID=UPI00118B1B36|nr:MnmC family methyltransferase [Methanofervidicoccus sp. A16]AXI25411.1 hypothetical protein CFE53_04400 [Methanofervidicoccus sp. A16]
MLPNKVAIDIIRKYMARFEKGEDIENFRKDLIRDLLNHNLLVKTEDGTYTLVSECKEELMHSRIGALRESIEKFVIPSDLRSMKNPKILDLCSGIGYNSIGALHYNKNCRIDMVECCKEVLFLSLCLDMPYEEHNIIKDRIKNFLEGDASRSDINIYLEDGRSAIKKLEGRYNVVFHDAFSPQRDAVLYTVDFLREVYKKMDDDGVLISYSSSIPFRSALVEAGFIISEGNSVGRKRGITIAYKNPSPDRKIRRIPLTDERLIAISTVGVPYRDPNLNLSHEEIIKNRNFERMIFKKKLLELGRYYSTKNVKLGKIDRKFLEIQKLDLNSTQVILKMREILGV